MNEKTVLAIDPGTSKCGLALVMRDSKGKQELLWRRIAPTDQLIGAVKEAAAIRPFELMIVGSGTNSKQVLTMLRSELAGAAILVVDEKDTTFLARERYWAHTKRRGWRSIFPATLQVPPEPVDDFSALILAERVLMQSI